MYWNWPAAQASCPFPCLRVSGCGGHRCLLQYDRGSQEAERIFPASFLSAGCLLSPYASETFDCGGDCQCPAYLTGAGKGFVGSSESLKAGRMVICPHLCPRRWKIGQTADLGYGADRLSCLPRLERRGIHCLSFLPRFLGDGTHPARGACTACVLCGRQEVTAQNGGESGPSAYSADGPPLHFVTSVR